MDPKQPYTELIRRLLKWSRKVGATAHPAVDSTVESPAAADLALLTGHPAGMDRENVRPGAAPWDVFPGHVARLDQDGVVVSVNAAWRQFGLANGAGPDVGVGSNYLDVCDRAAEQGEPEAEQAAEMVRAALAGAIDNRQLAYPVLSSSGQCWFRLQVAAFPGERRGALVVHLNISDDQARVYGENQSDAAAVSMQVGG